MTPGGSAVRGVEQPGASVWGVGCGSERTDDLERHPGFTVGPTL
jgi:hypothetical protein